MEMHLKILKVFGDSGVTSVYNIDSAEDMWEQTQTFIERAKSGEKVKLFLQLQIQL